MRKILFFCVTCLMALSMQAQRCAVLEFSAASGISISDVDGISEMFMTYFRPSGYTMVERAQIDRVISEQRFQKSSITEEQMVRLGKILNVSKVVVGKVSRLGGQYQVDVRVVDVELGYGVAYDGATFTGDYRTNVRNLAQRLASQIAIKQGPTVQARPTSTQSTQVPASTAPKKRSSVEILYDYLKIFPHELGTFSSEPSSVISQINSQAQYGYNSWRIPTNEELSLLRANNYLGSGTYMTKENTRGIVLLVTDTKDAATLMRESAQQAEELNYVDLGLPSGTKWKKNNESGLFSYNEAKNKYGNKMPTQRQFEELFDYCKQDWTGNGIKFTGPNGKSIVILASGRYDCYGKYENKYNVDYWSRTSYSDGETAYAIFYHYRDKEETVSVPGGGSIRFHKGIEGGRGSAERCKKFAVCLVR